VLLEAGADAIRVGMGVGSVSTKQLVSAVGRAQLSAVYSCARMAKKYNVPVIADGGLKNTGCIIKALAIGADCVMMGSLLAGTDESPGDYYYQNGIRLKSYNANNHRATEETITSSTSTTTSPVGSPMGSPSKPRLSSLDAQGRSSSFDFTYSTKSIQNVTYRVASGVSGAVVDKGKMDRYFPYLIQSIRHGLQDMGTESLKIMKEQLFSGALRFELRSASAQKEGGVHDLHSFQQRLFA
jgi:IMP dehydrogenase